MATAAIAGVGAQFKYSDMASSPTFAALSEVNSIEGPNITAETIDATSLDSVSGFREFIAGFMDGGEVSLNMNWTRDNYVLVHTWLTARALRDFQIVLPDTGATTYDFSAIITNVSKSIPTDDKVTMSVTLKVSGAETLSS